MTSAIQHTSVHCADPFALAGFWSEVLGLPVHPDDEPTDDEVGFPLADGRELRFLKVPEAKTVKHRLHQCVAARQPRDHEAERLFGRRDATMVADPRNEDGTGWAVLADPEGDEVCVLRGAADRPDEDNADQ